MVRGYVWGELGEVMVVDVSFFLCCGVEGWSIDSESRWVGIKGLFFLL